MSFGSHLAGVAAAVAATFSGEESGPARMDAAPRIQSGTAPIIKAAKIPRGRARSAAEVEHAAYPLLKELLPMTRRHALCRRFHVRQKNAIQPLCHPSVDINLTVLLHRYGLNAARSLQPSAQRWSSFPA